MTQPGDGLCGRFPGWDILDSEREEYFYPPRRRITYTSVEPVTIDFKKVDHFGKG